MLKQSLATVVFLAISACGGHSGGGGKAPNINGDKGNESFLMDAQVLNGVDQSVRSITGNDPSWTVHMTVNGAEKVNLQRVAIVQVSDSLKSVTLSRNDVLRFEVTISNPGGDKIYGTNLESVANSDIGNAQIWASQCAASVSPEISLQSLDLTKDDNGRVKIQVNVCDFVGFSLKPIVEIKPQAKQLEKKTVIYHCAVKPSTSTDELYTYTDTSCPYGYAAEPGETAPTISILKEFAPGEPLYTTKILVLDNFKLNLSNAGTIQLDTDFYAPPFGSHEGCHTQKVDVKYGTPDGIKTARLTFKRMGQADGSVIWMPQNTASWPSMTAIKNYYAQAGSQEKLDIYRICEWIPQAEELASGSVIQFAQ